MKVLRFDSIIIGAGHNGLVCAAYLAKSGQRVLVLEAADAPGGLAASREFHPGFHASVAHSVSHFSQKIARDLKLASHGFETISNTLPTVGLSADKKQRGTQFEHICKWYLRNAPKHRHQVRRVCCGTSGRGGGGPMPASIWWLRTPRRPRPAGPRRPAGAVMPAVGGCAEGHSGRAGTAPAGRD